MPFFSLQNDDESRTSGVSVFSSGVVVVAAAAAVVVSSSFVVESM